MRTLTIFTLLLSLSACGDDPPQVVPPIENPETAEIAETEPPAETEEVAENGSGEEAAAPSEPRPSAVTENYRVEAMTAANGYAAGEIGSFEIQLATSGEWHLNENFPTSVTIHEVDGIAFPSSSLSKDDAAEFGEEEARFDVPFTPEAGEQRLVQVDVGFAVCNPQSCMPQRETLFVPIAPQS